jgi:hypothetical protein
MAPRKKSVVEENEPKVVKKPRKTKAPEIPNAPILQVGISDMLRQTADNTSVLMVQIADHIDQMEAYIASLEQKIIELMGGNNAE